MKLEGCSNAGLSFTDKYKKAIMKIYEFSSSESNFRTYEYNEFQDVLSSSTSIGTSEIRMIIPFLIKLGIFNEAKIIRRKSRIKKIIIDTNSFTIEGSCFIKFLKIELQKDILNTNQMNIIKKIYAKFGLILFENLRKSDEYIYDDILIFLKKYHTIDKNEFFILTHCRKNNRMDLLDEYVSEYRSNKIKNIEIINNINAYQYITSFLEQIKILNQCTKNKLELGSLIKQKNEGGVNYEFRK